MALSRASSSFQCTVRGLLPGLGCGPDGEPGRQECGKLRKAGVAGGDLTRGLIPSCPCAIRTHPRMQIAFAVCKPLTCGADSKETSGLQRVCKWHSLAPQPPGPSRGLKCLSGHAKARKRAPAGTCVGCEQPLPQEVGMALCPAPRCRSLMADAGRFRARAAIEQDHLGLNRLCGRHRRGQHGHRGEASQSSMRLSPIRKVLLKQQFNSRQALADVVDPVAVADNLGSQLADVAPAPTKTSTDANRSAPDLR